MKISKIYPIIIACCSLCILQSCYVQIELGSEGRGKPFVSPEFNVRKAKIKKIAICPFENLNGPDYSYEYQHPNAPTENTDYDTYFWTVSRKGLTYDEAMLAQRATQRFWEKLSNSTNKLEIIELAKTETLLESLGDTLLVDYPPYYTIFPNIRKHKIEGVSLPGFTLRQFNTKDKEIEIGQKLGVDCIFKGTIGFVEYPAYIVYAKVWLLDCSDGTILWAFQYDDISPNPKNLSTGAIDKISKQACKLFEY